MTDNKYFNENNIEHTEKHDSTDRMNEKQQQKTMSVEEQLRYWPKQERPLTCPAVKKYEAVTKTDKELSDLVESRRQEIENDVCLNGMAGLFSTRYSAAVEEIEDMLSEDISYDSVSTDTHISGRKAVCKRLESISLMNFEGTDALPVVITGINPDANVNGRSIGDIGIGIRSIRHGKVYQLAFVTSNEDKKITNLTFEESSNYDYEWCFPADWRGFSPRIQVYQTLFDEYGNVTGRKFTYLNGEPIETE